AMAVALRALIAFYRTGEEPHREAYDIAWVQDKASLVDTINGFVEVYLDARSIKGAWEAIVFYVNADKTHQIRAIADHAQWFEDHMPWDPKYRKDGVRGVTARAIDVVIETGDSGPITPVGINLPNDQTIRERYGSKSISLANIVEAYDRSTLPEFRTEFSWSPEEAARAHRWSAFASELTTNMHEVIGHGSGRVSERLTVTPPAALREQFSTIEESRADLVALYFLPDPKLVELGLVPAADHAEIVRAEYEAYARNALVQLRRVRQGTHIEEDHMRNRQLIVHWLMAHTSAIEVRRRDGKTFYTTVDVGAFRDGVGRLLGEVQRVKAEGDYDGAKRLVETYGVHFDPALRDEVVARVDRLQLPSYTAFVMPTLDARRNGDGEIVDVDIAYPCDLIAQTRVAILQAEDRRAPTPADLATLRAGSRSDDTQTRRTAVLALGRLERPSLIPDLVPNLKSAAPEVRAEAANAIAQAAQGWNADRTAADARALTSAMESLIARLR